MTVSLILARGRYEGRVIQVHCSPFVIGRHAACHLRPGSRRVGQQHCAVVVTAKRVVIRDLHSGLATLVNGRPVTGEVAVQAGDRLEVGPLGFIVWLGTLARSEQAVCANITSAQSLPDDEVVAASILLEADAGRTPAPEESAGPPPDPSALPAISDNERRLAEAERCDFANYAEPRRKLVAGDAARAALSILRQYRYRWRGPSQ
jgi:pSer/pThr/pTyr-binding forkhead associated (FHA) protein